MENEIKVAIIEENGNIDKMLFGEEDHYHFYHLGEYARNHYSMEELIGTDFKNTNSLSLTLREFGNIVFLDNTSYIDGVVSKHGKTSIMMLPDEITEEQKNALSVFENDIKDYNELQIWYGFTSRNDGHVLIGHGEEEILEIINKSISEIDAVNAKKR